MAETGLTVENPRGRVRGSFHAWQWEMPSMAAKAIVALLVLGSACAVAARLRLATASQADVGRLQGPLAKIHLLPERGVRHRLRVPA